MEKENGSNDLLEYTRKLARAVKEIETITGKKVNWIEFIPTGEENPIQPTKIIFVDPVVLDSEGIAAILESIDNTIKSVVGPCGG